jgi:hypothetical protein
MGDVVENYAREIREWKPLVGYGSVGPSESREWSQRSLGGAQVGVK